MRSKIDLELVKAFCPGPERRVARDLGLQDSGRYERKFMRDAPSTSPLAQFVVFLQQRNFRIGATDAEITRQAWQL